MELSMENRIKLVNLALVVLTVGSVLQIRMETASISYKISRDFKYLKDNEAQASLLSAQYEKQVGSERMVSEAGGMVALSSPKTEQVVMIDSAGLAITR